MSRADLKLPFCQNQFFKSKSRCQSCMICRQCSYYGLLNFNISADLKLCNLLLLKNHKSQTTKIRVTSQISMKSVKFLIKMPKRKESHVWKRQMNSVLLALFSNYPQPVALLCIWQQENKCFGRLSSHSILLKYP